MKLKEEGVCEVLMESCVSVINIDVALGMIMWKRS